MTTKTETRYEIIASANTNDEHFSECPDSAKYGISKIHHTTLDAAKSVADDLASSGDWLRDGIDYTPTYRVHDNEVGKYIYTA